jgi:hypothetical protein
MRRKGELSAAGIDRGWPQQIVLPARLCERGGYNEIHEFCRDLTLALRGHALDHPFAPSTFFNSFKSLLVGCLFTRMIISFRIPTRLP